MTERLDDQLRSDKPSALRAVGVARMHDNDQAVLVCFDRKPTDDELREVHDTLAGRPTARSAVVASVTDHEKVAKELDSIEGVGYGLTHSQLVAVRCARDILRATRSASGHICEWLLDIDGIYHTACGHELSARHSEDRGVKFCQCCGGHNDRASHCTALLPEANRRR